MNTSNDNHTPYYTNIILPHTNLWLGPKLNKILFHWIIVLYSLSSGLFYKTHWASLENLIFNRIYIFSQLYLWKEISKIHKCSNSNKEGSRFSKLGQIWK